MPALKKVFENIEVRIINEPIKISPKKKSKFLDRFLGGLLKERLKMNIKKARINKIRKIFAVFAILLLLVTYNPYLYVFAAPSLPSSPSTPDKPSTPDLPDTPDKPNTPDLPDTPSNYDGGSEGEETSEPATDENSSDESTSPTNTTSEENNKDTTTESNTNSGNGETAEGQMGDTSVETGDVTNTAIIDNTANNNLATEESWESGGEVSGITVVNGGNGTNSTNDGSASISKDNNTTQGNSASVVNNLEQETITGGNSASKNTGGDSEIETGDANTSGTIINDVNSNISGLSVYEFNIVDDHTGDYILTYDDAHCISGCIGGATTVKNTGNGSDSTNTGDVNIVSYDDTFQENDATVENNMTLTSNSGDNTADKNTNGDTSIATGDANVSANALTFANTNVEGGIVYGIVNIYGDLYGDIILPDGTVFACCILDSTVANTDNGSNSTNTANFNQTNSNTTNQYNSVDIENVIYADANTGGNSTSNNTGGDSFIETGDANVIVQVVNFVNNNIVGGDWWLVIINEGGKWIGKIIGALDGANYAGSDGFDISESSSGELTVTNSSNGGGSENTAIVNSETNTKTTQENNAKVVNNLNLTANTGGNSASKNTGGDSSISTGDANIIANIVNFVNNNIVGSGRLFVTVINVFGSWLGDFVGPGKEKEVSSNTDNSGIGGSSYEQSQSQTGSDGSEGDNALEIQIQENILAPTTVSPEHNIVEVFQKTDVSQSSSDEEGEAAMVAGINTLEDQPLGRKVVKVNLAWLVIALPLIGLYIVRRKKLSTAHAAA